MDDPIRVSRFDPAKIKKRVIFPILISLGSMAFIFSFTSFRGISIEEIEKTRFHFPFLGVALLVLLVTWMVDGLRVCLTARAWDKKIAFRNALAAVLSQYFMSSITPFMTGGSPAQLYVLARSGLGWGEASSLVVICGILYQASLLLLL
ncbi:MAG: flippase-like domain-containing protein, partial [Treponemataceae bacterium]|nr:flippase-like domain-containing protein [Treponemataceae bacterium]